MFPDMFNCKEGKFLKTYTVELQWGCFELVLESLGKKIQQQQLLQILENLGVFLFHIEKSILCVLIRIASMRRFY